MSDINPRFRSFILKSGKRIEDLLSSYLKSATKSAPKTFGNAMKYAVLNGGKRLRPIFIYAVGRAYKANIKSLDAAALAIEVVHSFSLVHDDLPAMDDDSLRRGRPTCHLAFDESTAILAGDALLVLAFQVLSENRAISADKKIKMIKVLAHALGPHGIAGGQYLDLHMPKRATKNTLEKMYDLKTGALISAAIKLGALAAGVRKKDLEKLEKFAFSVGLAFQIKDDILNIEGDVTKIGKNTGTDKRQNKITYPMLVGMEKAKSKLEKLCRECEKILRDLGIEDSFLGDLSRLVINREF